MKKTKIVGVAAATLLALTPATTTAFASTTNNSNVSVSKAVGAASFDDVMNGIKGFVDGIIKVIQNNSNQPDANKTPQQQATGVVNGIKDVTYDEGHPVIITTDKLKDNMDKPLSSNEFAHLAGEQLNLMNSDQGKTVSDADNYTYTLNGGGAGTSQDVLKMVDNLPTGNGAQAKLTITTNDKNDNNKVVNTKTVTFTNNAKTISKTANLKIDYKTSINVATGSNTLDLTLSASGYSNTTVTDGRGSNVAYTADPGNFYPSALDARNNTNALKLGAKFLEKGATYYQPVVLQFDPANINVYDIAYAADVTGDRTFDLNGKRVLAENINKYGKENSVFYVREITVGKDQPTNPDSNNNNNNGGNPTNPTNPADPVGVWKTTSQPGVLSVNNKVANLVGEDSTYTTRALAPNTQWATDAYRENSKTGARQYRVSTNEWVSAEDVSFRNRTPEFFTNVLKLPQIQTVYLDGPDGFIYALFNQDGIRADRGLPGNTGWATDERAVDAQGNIYYRVSTNEWIQRGTGVYVN